MTFTIPDSDKPVIDKFKKKQTKLEKGKAGTIGDNYTYSFTPTGIGIVVRITNNITKAVLDLSHYEEW